MSLIDKITLVAFANFCFTYWRSQHSSRRNGTKCVNHASTLSSKTWKTWTNVYASSGRQTHDCAMRTYFLQTLEIKSDIRKSIALTPTANCEQLCDTGTTEYLRRRKYYESIHEPPKGPAINIKVNPDSRGNWNDPQPGVVQEQYPRTAICVRIVDVHVSCSSHFDAQFAAFFIDPRAKWSTV